MVGARFFGSPPEIDLNMREIRDYGSGVTGFEFSDFCDCIECRRIEIDENPNAIRRYAFSGPAKNDIRSRLPRDS